MVFHVAAGTVVKILAIAAVFYALAQLVVLLYQLLITLAVAVFLAVAADPLVRHLQNRGLGRGAAVAIFVAALLTVLGIILWVFVPPLVEQGAKLIDDAPGYVQEIRKSETFRTLDSRYNILDRASNQIAALPAQLADQLSTVVTAIAAGLFGAFTVLFLMVLLMLGGGSVVSGIAQVFPTIAERRWWSLVQGAYRSVGAYVGGTLIVATLAGVVLLIAQLALGLTQYALPLSLWMSLFAIIPLVGATIGSVPAIAVALIVGGWVKALILLVVVIVYQQIEGAFIQPTILGRVVSLPPLIIFLSVLIGAKLMGIIGALLAVPVAGIVQIILRELLADDSAPDVDLPPIAPDEVPPPPESGASVQE